MTSTMRAALLTGSGGRALEMQQVGETPRPGPGELLVKVEASGICHTDLHIKDAASFPPGSPTPLILGHEGIGIVVDRGADATQIPLGTRVGAAWLHDTCDHCRLCLTGFESFCATHRAHGYTVNGAFADYVIVKERFAPRIPVGLDPVLAAPLMCAGVTAYGAVLKADLGPRIGPASSSAAAGWDSMQFRSQNSPARP